MAGDHHGRLETTWQETTTIIIVIKHHHVTHSNNAIGPAPHRGGKRTPHRRYGIDGDNVGSSDLLIAAVAGAVAAVHNAQGCYASLLILADVRMDSLPGCCDLLCYCCDYCVTAVTYCIAVRLVQAHTAQSNAMAPSLFSLLQEARLAA